jgi:AcrR family transcriptional regulator
MSPRTPHQFQEIRDEKRALIMAVALEHFANEGYFKTTIIHIARHAGISKGLMYNYFKSKEELLIAIINKSIEDIAQYFDLNRDGYLSEDEFEMFIRKLFSLIREKISFWRLFSQLLIQKDVRDHFLKSSRGEISTSQVMYTNRSNTVLSLISKMITEYFKRKKEKKPSDYDPQIDMTLFICTIEGFARITIYKDDVDETNYMKTLNKIIELYK